MVVEGGVVILSWLRWATAPLDRWLGSYCRDLASREFAARRLADAQQCPDEIEPPEETPIFEEIRTERILDAANARWFERGEADLALWEYEYRTRTGKL